MSCQLSFLEFDVNVSFNHSKLFQSDRIQRSCSEKFTAHYACRNADLNWRLVAATANGFIFQIIDSFSAQGMLDLP